MQNTQRRWNPVPRIVPEVDEEAEPDRSVAPRRPASVRFAFLEGKSTPKKASPKKAALEKRGG